METWGNIYFPVDGKLFWLCLCFMTFVLWKYDSLGFNNYGAMSMYTEEQRFQNTRKESVSLVRLMISKAHHKVVCIKTSTCPYMGSYIKSLQILMTIFHAKDRQVVEIAKNALIKFILNWYTKVKHDTISAEPSSRHSFSCLPYIIF